MRHNGLIVLLLQEPLEAKLDPCLNSHVPPEFLRISSLGLEAVFTFIFIHKGLHIRFGHGSHAVGDLIYRIGVYLPAEFDLCFNLVALGHCHISHIVCHAHDTDMTGLDHAHCGPHPGCDLLLYDTVLPEAHHDLPLDPHAADDVAVLPVTVCRLILVHEIHVYGIVRQLLIILRVQVEQRFPILLKSQDPGLGRRKGMHPGDDSCTALVFICFVKCFTDQLIGDQHRLPYHLIRQYAGCIQRIHDLCGMCSDMLQNLVPIQILGTGTEPKLIVFLLQRKAPPSHVFRHKEKFHDMPMFYPIA